MSFFLYVDMAINQNPNENKLSWAMHAPPHSQACERAPHASVIPPPPTYLIPLSWKNIRYY